MRRSVADVLAQLEAEGLVTPTARATAADALRAELADDMPWYLRVVVGLGAWIATGFLIFSLVAVARIDDVTSRLVIGSVLIGAAVLLRRTKTGEFLRWAAVAMALAGQGLVVAGVAQLASEPTWPALACLGVAVLLVVLVRDVVLRFLATLSGAGALIIALVAMEMPQGYDFALLLVVVAAAWIWRVRLTERSDALEEMLAPVGYGLVVVLFAALLVRTFAVTGRSSFGLGPGRDFSELGALATIGCALALLLLAWKVLDELGVALNAPLSFAILAGVVAFGVGTLDSPGVVAGTATLMLAFDRRNRELLLLATVFLLTFGALYYYSLELTLLQKSGVLTASGVLLLAIRTRIVADRGEGGT